MGFFGGSNEATAKLKVNYDGKKAESGLKSLKTTIKTVVSVAVVKKVLDYTVALAKMGMQAEIVEKNFKRFAARGGRDADVMMQKLRKASLGMVDDIALQQKAMEAMIAGVDFDDAITTMEYVSRYAIATGKDVNSKLQTVFTGLARKSAMFFDDVGIQIKGSEDVVGRAITQMKEKMGDFADAEGSASMEAAKLGTELINLAQNIGRSFIPVLESMLPILSDLTKGVGKYFDSWLKAAEVAGRMRSGQGFMQAMEAVTIEMAVQESTQERLNDLMARRQPVLNEIEKIEEKIAYWRKRGWAGIVYNLEKEMTSLQTREQALAAGMMTIIEKMAAASKKDKESGGAKTPTALTPEQLKAAKTAEEKRIKGIKDFWAEVNRIWEEQGKLRQSIGRKQNEYLDKLIEKEQSEELENLETNLQEKEFLYSQGLAAKGEILNAELALIDEREEQGLVSQRAAQLEREKLYAQDVDAFSAAQKQKEADARTWINSFATVTNAFQALSDARTQREIDNIDKDKMSREQYAAAVDKIEADRAEKNKIFARMQQGVIIARAISDAIAMGIGAGRDAFGGPVTRGIAMGATIAAGMAQVGAIEAQHFQYGGLVNDRLGSNGPDDTMIHARSGEFVVNPRATADNLSELQAINAGINRMSQQETGNVTLVGLTTEQVVAATATARRRRLI